MRGQLLGLLVVFFLSISQAFASCGTTVCGNISCTSLADAQTAGNNWIAAMKPSPYPNGGCYTSGLSYKCAVPSIAAPSCTASFNYPAPTCTAPQTMQNGTCQNCPSGTVYDAATSSCIANPCIAKSGVEIASGYTSTIAEIKPGGPLSAYAAGGFVGEMPVCVDSCEYYFKQSAPITAVYTLASEPYQVGSKMFVYGTFYGTGAACPVGEQVGLGGPPAGGQSAPTGCPTGTHSDNLSPPSCIADSAGFTCPSGSHVVQYGTSSTGGVYETCVSDSATGGGIGESPTITGTCDPGLTLVAGICTDSGGAAVGGGTGGTPGASTQSGQCGAPGFPACSVSDPLAGSTPATGSWWTKSYAGGVAGVWTDHQGAINQTPLIAGLKTLAPTFTGSASCPTFTVPTFTMNSRMSISTGKIDVACWIFDAIGALVLLSAAFASRQIIFGG